MGRPVVHFELWSRTPDKLSAFYTKLFDWNVESMPGMDYRIIQTQADGGICGGIMTPKCEGPWPGNMSFYVEVDDLAAYRKRVVEVGGKILVEEQQVPGKGSFSLFEDPDGRVVGLWKMAAH